MRERIGTYKVGEQVYAKVRRNIPLIIRLYARGVYYCYEKHDKTDREHMHFESELITYHT